MQAYLHQIAVSNANERRNALLRLLNQYPFPVIEEITVIGSYRPRNIRILTCDQAQPRWLVGAHYDSVEGSTGANDNAAAVAILIALLEKHLKQPYLPPTEFVFFDLEEAEMQGSLAYVHEHDLTSI